MVPVLLFQKTWLRGVHLHGRHPCSSAAAPHFQQSLASHWLHCTLLQLLLRRWLLLRLLLWLRLWLWLLWRLGQHLL